MKWVLKSKAPSAFLKQFPEYTSLIAQLLYNRDLRTQKAIDEFFNPDYCEDFHDPYLLKGMGKAVKRILKAVKKGERITVYGDFDADGVCASAVLYLALKKIGARRVDSYIPDREKENHGLNENSVKELAQRGTNL
ncbi:MAG: DHH family phosphoesterase, partial [Candidatus Portnoybacteria bacterium]